MSPSKYILHTGPQLTRRALVQSLETTVWNPPFITFLMLLNMGSPLNISLLLSWPSHQLPVIGNSVYTQLCHFLLGPLVISSLLPLLPRIPASKALGISTAWNHRHFASGHMHCLGGISEHTYSNSFSRALPQSVTLSPSLPVPPAQGLCTSWPWPAKGVETRCAVSRSSTHLFPSATFSLSCYVQMLKNKKFYQHLSPL